MTGALKRHAKRLLYAADRTLYARGLRSPNRLDLPDFLGLGPGQSGSTWMFKHLSRHPDVFFPSMKEVNYFDRHLHEWPLAHYAALFAAGRGKVSGEITPGYCVLRQDRIAFLRRVVPDVRLILTVRDPVERSWSAARRVLAKLGKTVEELGAREMRKYLRREWAYRPPGIRPVSGDYEDGLLEGHYSRIFDNWTRHFPPEQLLVVFFGQIEGDPEGFLDSVCRHIGVRTDFEWDPLELRTRVNPNPSVTLPDDLRDYLEEMYADEIDRIYDRFGKPARRWLRSAGAS